jgi:predicted transcriptional regulator
MLNRSLVLNTLIKHETLTIDDIAKEENLGVVPNEEHLHSILDELTASEHIHILGSAKIRTYTITDKGIREVEKLKSEETATS